MNKNVLAAIVAVVVIGGGLIWYSNSKNSDTADSAMENHDRTENTNTTPSPTPTTPTPTPTPTPSAETPTPTPTTPSPTPSTTGTTKEFTVTGSNFKFSMSEIKVNKGDKVKITFKNESGFHDFVIDEFAGAKTKQISGGASETIEFVADKTGTFEYYCSVGQHRSMGMKGNLIVQ